MIGERLVPLSGLKSRSNYYNANYISWNNIILPTYGYYDNKEMVAMENDLISRSALKKTLLEKCFYPAIVNHVLKNAPAVDAVEVVRCKDCKHFEIDEGDFLGLCKCGSIATNHGGEIYPEEDFFCAYGERRWR